MDVGAYPGFSSTTYEDDEDSSSHNELGRGSSDGYNSGGGGGGGGTGSSHSLLDKRHRSPFEADRKKRRAIANSNERKRMQSINAGFLSLRSLVCPKSGEKLSKAAILKYTADFIKSLLAEKQQLLVDNRYLEQLVCNSDVDPEKRCHKMTSHCSLSLPGKRRCREGESISSDEGIGFASTEEIVSNRNTTDKKSLSELQRQVLELQEEVKKEKTLRLLAEREKTRVEKLPLMQPVLPSQQVPTSSSSSNSTSSSSSTASNVTSSMGDLWRRGLETIVEAIRHVEGDHAIFGSTQTSRPEPLNHVDVVDCKESVRPSVTHAGPLLLRQLQPTCIRNTSSDGFPSANLLNPDCFVIQQFHRTSLAVPSS